MPRQADPGNASGAEKTREWRERVKGQRRPEVDAVDTAIVAAVSVFRWTAEKAKSERNVTKAEGLEIMAVNYLVAKGYDLGQAQRQVRRRVRRHDVEDLIPLVNGPVGGDGSVSKSDVSLTPSTRSR